MSLEQIEEVLQELSENRRASEIKPLRKEYEAKLLMRRLPTLERPLAIDMLSDDDPWKHGASDEKAADLAQVFINNGLQAIALQEVRAWCAPGGQKLFDNDDILGSVLDLLLRQGTLAPSLMRH